MTAEAVKEPAGEALPDDQIQLRLKWRRTWKDTEDDFCCEDPERGVTSIGRFYYSLGGQIGKGWLWTVYAAVPHFDGSTWNGGGSGVADTPRQAAKCIEDDWFRIIKGTPLELPLKQRNAYAAAKDPG
jgi:hypothetical protein